MLLCGGGVFIKCVPTDYLYAHGVSSVGSTISSGCFVLFINFIFDYQ